MKPANKRLLDSIKLLPVIIAAAVVMIILQEAGCYDPGEYRILDMLK